MKSPCRPLLVLVTVLLSAWFVNGRLIAQTSTTLKEKEGDELVALPAKLEGFVRVTEEPVLMKPAVALACANFLAIEDGHRSMLKQPEAMLHIYVTPIGEKAMREIPLLNLQAGGQSAAATLFPVGTVILKEKFSSAAAKTPELYTGMRKREAGYNPACGDWEFFVMTGDRRAVTARGRIDSCMDCHQRYPHSDFVTKTYLR